MSSCWPSASAAPASQVVGHLPPGRGPVGPAAAGHRPAHPPAQHRRCLEQLLRMDRGSGFDPQIRANFTDRRGDPILQPLVDIIQDHLCFLIELRHISIILPNRPPCKRQVFILSGKRPKPSYRRAGRSRIKFKPCADAFLSCTASCSHYSIAFQEFQTYV